MSEFILSYEEAYTAGAEFSGGKGFNLGRLRRYGIDIPDGFVISAAAYEMFIDHNGLRDKMDRDTAQKLITAGDFPDSFKETLAAASEKYTGGMVSLAVRSSVSAEDSAGASFAGIHDSFLNVSGIENVLSAVKMCYASVWSRRAVTYRDKMGFSDFDIGIAVVVMKTVAADAAGVVFSCDPVTGREDRQIISANFGLGESVVSGVCEPDEYIVTGGRDVEFIKGSKGVRTVFNPDGGTVSEESASDSFVLNREQVLELSGIVSKIFSRIGGSAVHQDIEWVLSVGRFYIVQTRPVTAMNRYSYPEITAQPAMWSNANLRDSLPMVQTPMNWSTCSTSIDTILNAQIECTGYKPDKSTRKTKLINGRAYFDVSVLQWECYDSFGFKPEMYNIFIGGHHGQIKLPVNEGFGKKLLRFKRNLKFYNTLKKARKNSKEIFASAVADADRLINLDFSGMVKRKLVDTAWEIGVMLEKHNEITVLLTSSGSVFVTLVPMLEKFCKGQGLQLTSALLAGLGGITSAEFGQRIKELAEVFETTEFDQKFAEMLRDYGHRGVYEVDMYNPRFSEDASFIMDMVQQYAKNPPKPMKNNSEEAWAIVREKVPFYLHGIIKKMVKQAGEDGANREMAKSVFARFSAVMRRVVLESGRRLAADGVLADADDVWFLTFEEMSDILLNGGREWVKNLTADRRTLYEYQKTLQTDDVYVEGGYDVPETETDGSEMNGMSVSCGRATGEACVILHPAEGGSMKSGGVLVAPSTDPSWTPLFVDAAALVLETGGFISHGAIVAREYGIPAIMNIKRATDIIKSGEILFVDGWNGTVKRII
ncbi:MAG: PEP/pyruvate-binding domain-containing protein [Deferribacterales bacterium]